MTRARPPRPWPLGLGLLVIGACGPADASGAEDRAVAAAPAPAPTPAPAAETEPPAWPLPDEMLHPWETALVMIDPRHLTRTQRLQRAYARRKMLMLNPDSATARVLDDLAKAADAGEIDPSVSGTPGPSNNSVVFTAPGVAPKGAAAPGAPPAGARPPAGASPRSE